MRIALGLLPLLTFCSIATALHIYQQLRRTGSWPSFRNSLLQAAAFCGLWVVVGTETFSAVSKLSFWPVFFWWLIPLIGCIFYICNNLQHARFRKPNWRATHVEKIVLVP